MKLPFKSIQSHTYFSDGSEDCTHDEWSKIANFQVRREKRNGYHTCSIHGRIGADVTKSEEVKWII